MCKLHLSLGEVASWGLDEIFLKRDTMYLVTQIILVTHLLCLFYSLSLFKFYIVLSDIPNRSQTDYLFESRPPH